MTIFNGTVTQKKTPKIWCTTTGCEQLVVSVCMFKLSGKLEGQTCGRALCAGCAGVSSMCPSHQRLTQKRAGV